MNANAGADALENPVARFQHTLARASAASAHVAVPGGTSSPDPTASTLATADEHGVPSARIVLLKEVDDRGFVFYTNRESRKGRELAANPRAAMVFLWPALGEQVRIEGRVEETTDAESDAYFASRPRDSQIGAWASVQSARLGSRDELLARAKEIEARFAGRVIPRPAHWGGFRIVPNRIEFWAEGAYRMHYRDVYERHSDGKWHIHKLFP